MVRVSILSADQRNDVIFPHLLSSGVTAFVQLNEVPLAGWVVDQRNDVICDDTCCGNLNLTVIGRLGL